MPPITRAEARRAYLRWTRAAGPFWAYAGLTPLCGDALPASADRPDAPALIGTARRVLEAQVVPLLPESSVRLALVLDLPIALSLASSAPLLDAGFVPVPFVYRWPIEPSNLSAPEAAALLVALAPTARATEQARGVALLLDSQRFEGASPFSPARFDGRYHYPPDVLPPPHALLDWGIAAVVFVSDRVQLRDDLGMIADRYARSGLQRADLWVDLAAAPESGAVGS